MTNEEIRKQASMAFVGASTAILLLLGVRREEWVRLQLCRAPSPERWETDLDQISQHFGCNRAALERAVKEV